MLTVKTFIIHPSHPSIAGHFPEHPVVPGVVLLEQIEIALDEHLQNWEVIEIVQAKFIEIVLPGETVEVKFNDGFMTNPQSINFQLVNSATQKRVVTGKVKLAIIKEGI